MFYRDDLFRAAAASKNPPWNHRKIGDESGYDRMTVGRVMKGDPRAAYETVFAIAKALGFERIPDEPLTNAGDMNALAEALPKEKIA